MRSARAQFTHEPRGYRIQWSGHFITQLGAWHKAPYRCIVANPYPGSLTSSWHASRQAGKIGSRLGKAGPRTPGNHLLSVEIYEQSSDTSPYSDEIGRATSESTSRV